MKQKLFIIAAILVFTVSAAACSAKNGGSASTAAAKTETTAAADRTNDASTAEADAADLSTGDPRRAKALLPELWRKTKAL